jgi:hypothetical protein
MKTPLFRLKTSSRGAYSQSNGVKLAFGAAILLLPPSVFSQSSPNTQAAIQQMESFKGREKAQSSQTRAKAEGETVPELYAGESSDMGAQMLLREKPVIRYFEANADTSFTYTSNANLDTRNPIDTGISVTTLSLAFAPDPWEVADGKLSLRSGYRHIFWIYDVKRQVDTNNLNAGNFQLSSFFVSSRYVFREHWAASFGVDHNRIMLGKSNWRMGRLFEAGNWNEVYTEFNPNWSLDRMFSLTTKITGSLSYSGGYHFTYTDPNTAPSPTRIGNDHLNNALMLSLMYAPVEQWLVQPYIRGAHAAFTRSGAVKGNEHRRDLTRSLGVNVVWSPTERTSIRASISGEFRNSNDPVITDYSKFEAATGLSFTFRF